MPAVTMHSGQRETSPRLDESSKPVILHIGDAIEYHLQLHDRLKSQFRIINPPAEDLQRPAFLDHLRNKTWGDFVAIIRPFWNTGGEMGQWDEELIELLPKKLKVYASAGAGYDWVNTDVLAEHGILYCNSRGAPTEAVADMALYLIISVFRCMTRSQLAARSLDTTQFEHAHRNLPMISHNPRDHTLGIIGLGDIGFAIANKVKAAFGMEILYNDIVQKPEQQEVAVSATFCPRLEDLLERSDCVLIATPFAGKQLVTASLLSYFKPGARLVNIARGSLVDEEALANALDSGKLTAVGMDVHANEPHPNARLADNRDVTMTCHTGGGALETIKGFERLAMENVDAVLNGREALTAVNAHLIRRPGVGAGTTDHGGINGHMTNGEYTDDHDHGPGSLDNHLANGHGTDEIHEDDVNGGPQHAQGHERDQ